MFQLNASALVAMKSPEYPNFELIRENANVARSMTSCSAISGVN
jgi:hypothetical protein